MMFSRNRKWFFKLKSSHTALLHFGDCDLSEQAVVRPCMGRFSLIKAEVGPTPLDLQTFSLYEQSLK